MARGSNEDYYIIPHNYTDNGKILGIIEPQSVWLAGPWFAVWALLDIFFIPLSISLKVGFLIIVGVFPALIILVGVGPDTTIDFIKFVINYYKRAKIYTYEK